MPIELDEVQFVSEVISYEDSMRLAYISASEKLTSGQREQAFLMAEYSIGTAFRYSKFCENKLIIKCKCGSFDVAAKLQPMKRTRYEKKPILNFKAEYSYSCLSCGKDVKKPRDISMRD